MSENTLYSFMAWRGFRVNGKTGVRDMQKDDVIYRQTAIDALDCINGTEEVLRSLPSAQPDGIPLEWIDKHLEWLDNCDNDFAQLAKVSIRAMVEIWKKDKT